MGRVARPAFDAERPTASCKNSATNNVPSDTAAYRNTVATLPTAKLRTANRFSGIIGFGALRSQNGNATRQATPTTSPPATAGFDNPSRCSSISANTAALSPTAHSVAPTKSIRAQRFATTPSRVASLLPWAIFVVRYSVTASGTMLMPNTHRQLRASTSTPPSGGPTTNAVPVHAVHVPIARACAAPVNRALIIASELGTRKAAPTPCRHRAATSTHPFGATAHSTEATAKTASPARSTVSLPN